MKRWSVYRFLKNKAMKCCSFYFHLGSSGLFLATVKILLRHLKLAPDFLERNLGFPELKGSPFFLSGEGFASGNLDRTHGELKLIFSDSVRLLKYTAKTKVFCLGRWDIIWNVWRHIAIQPKKNRRSIAQTGRKILWFYYRSVSFAPTVLQNWQISHFTVETLHNYELTSGFLRKKSVNQYWA